MTTETSGHPAATKPTCDAREASVLGGGRHLVTGQGSDIDVIRGRKIQISDFCPVLGAVLQGAALQGHCLLPASAADLDPEACAGA